MNEHDVIRFMGRFPDAINPEPMKSNVWKCSACGKLVVREKEIRNPTICKRCGGMFFETVGR